MLEYYKRKLPHWIPEGHTFFVTLRLVNSLPIKVIRDLQHQHEQEIRKTLANTNGTEQEAELYKLSKKYFGQFDAWLDNCIETSPQWLTDERIAGIVIEELHRLDDERYKLQGYTILSNHIHIALDTLGHSTQPAHKGTTALYPLTDTLRLFKGRTARACNHLLNRSGPFWHAESYDHVVRNQKEFERILEYILENPVRAGLVKHWQDWKFSYHTPDFTPFAARKPGDSPSTVGINPDLPACKPGFIPAAPKIVALAGGVGGAKLADGLAQVLPPENLTVIVNTGDDFTHWGMNISPDLDTVCYTLAGLANPTTGWGRIDESWSVFEQMSLLGAEAWFRLGDKDLATHLERTRRLSSGEPLSSITGDFCRRWGIRHTILPMTDEPVATMVDTVEMGELAFQEYFVHQRCEPTVKGFRFAGIETAKPAPGVLEALENADAIVICPSNPWVSVDPILKTLKNQEIFESRPLVAVSPIIGGKTVKGPAAKMFAELGIEPSALAVAKHYGGPLLTGFVLDTVDAGLTEDVAALGISSFSTNTIMTLSDNRRQLAQDVLNFIKTLQTRTVS